MANLNDPLNGFNSMTLQNNEPFRRRCGRWMICTTISMAVGFVVAAVVFIVASVLNCSWPSGSQKTISNKVECLKSNAGNVVYVLPIAIIFGLLTGYKMMDNRNRD